jgi:hypothetical protein
MNFKLIFCLLLILTFLGGFASAQVLVNTDSSKEELTKNEVAFLNMKLKNDTGEDIQNYVLRIEASDNIEFLESKTNIFVKNVELLERDLAKEIQIKFKAIDTSRETGELFVYYGDKGQYVSGTYVEIYKNPIIVTSNLDRKNTEQGEKIIVSLQIENYLDEPITNIAMEVLASEDFEILTEPQFKESLGTNETMKKEFELIPPLGLSGQEDIILSYGYFNSKGVHYFEKDYTIKYANINNSLITLVAIIVLIVAIVLYMGKSTKPKGIKGTEEKADEMPEEEKSDPTK